MSYVCLHLRKRHLFELENLISSLCPKMRSTTGERLRIDQVMPQILQEQRL